MSYLKKLIILVVINIISNPLYGFDCFATNVALESADTLSVIITKQQEVLSEYDNYKQALEVKKDDMIELLRTVKKIEALLITNQVQRKNILKLWKDKADMYVIPQQ